MKWLFIFVLISFRAYAQEEITTSVEGGRFSMSLVTDAPGTKDQIFERSKESIGKHFTKGLKSIIYDSKDESKIIARARTIDLVYKNMFVNIPGGYFVYDITILTKDGRSKIVIDNVLYKKGGMAHMRDDCDFADEFPSTWTKTAMAEKQTRTQWAIMKEHAKKDMITTMLFFKVSLSQPSRSEEF